MKGVNKCIFVGTLGRDPETKTFQNGGSICSFSIAVNESWNDKQTGERKERTEWINIVANGKLAEVCDTYLKKGSKVYVEGKMKTRKYQSHDGTDRYTTEIVAAEMQMLDSRPESAPPGYSQPSGQQYSQPAPRPKIPQQTPAFDDFEDDIPF